MSELRDLYQEVILDHNRNPRNFREIPDCGCSADGHNPLCGDRVKVFCKLDGDTVEDVSFQGEGCAISKASSSLMTETVRGKSRGEIDEIFEHFHRMVTTDGKPPEDFALGKLKVMAGVAEYPMRVKCATLAWHTLQAALQGEAEPVSTE